MWDEARELREGRQEKTKTKNKIYKLNDSSDVIIKICFCPNKWANGIVVLLLLLLSLRIADQHTKTNLYRYAFLNGELIIKYHDIQYTMIKMHVCTVINAYGWMYMCAMTVPNFDLFIHFWSLLIFAFLNEKWIKKQKKLLNIRKSLYSTWISR